MAEQQQGSNNVETNQLIQKFIKDRNESFGDIGIYKLTSPSGKVYIGQSWSIKKRFSYYKNPHHSKEQIKLHRSIKKYGFDNFKFKIIHLLPYDTSQKIMDEYEVLYWQLYKDCGVDMLNVKEPGSGGKHSEETKRKIGMASKGNKYALGNLNRLGMKHSQETKEKIRNTKKGIPLSTEARKNVTAANKKRINYDHVKKVVLDMSTGIFYNSGKEAADLLGYNRNTLNHWLTGYHPNKTSLNYV